MFIIVSIYVRPFGIIIIFLFIWIAIIGVLICNYWRSIPQNMQKRYLQEKENYSSTEEGEEEKKEHGNAVMEIKEIVVPNKE